MSPYTVLAGILLAAAALNAANAYVSYRNGQPQPCGLCLVAAAICVIFAVYAGTLP